MLERMMKHELTASLVPAMTALVVDRPGAPFRLATLDRPAAGPGQVLIRVHASGVNPLDTKIRAGAAEHARHPLPAVLGLDVAGVVEAIGPGVDGRPSVALEGGPGEPYVP